MHKFNHKLWVVIAILALMVIGVGCGDPDENPGSSKGLVPPTVTVTPPNGSVGLCPNTVVTAMFNVAMNPSTIDASTFTLTGPGTTPVTGVVTFNTANDTAIFSPAVPLALSTPYTATITTGAHDVYGNALAANFVWKFTTGVTNCLPSNPPVAITPPDGSNGICPATVIAATFPQAMDPTTITSTTFIVSPGVTGTITHDVTNKIFTLTPSAPLALNTIYTATITTGAKNPTGNALASNYVWTFKTATVACALPPPPSVISVTPPNGRLGVCPNAVVTATFNEAMKSSSISTTTFQVIDTNPTIAGAGSPPGILGTVTLDNTGKIAEFAPTNDLALNTTYTATITTGAQDLAGNALAANYVWSFTTSKQICQPPVPLGSAATFEVIAGTTVTNTGPTIITGGDLGLSPGTAVTGFPPGTLVLPAMVHITDSTAAQAQLDLTVAYNYAAGLPGGAVLPGDMAGLTFTPGLYKSTSTVMLSVGNVTLDAQGNANSVFIFQVASTLTTLGSTNVILAGGAQAKNVFWQVGSSATLGTNSAFQGTILSLQSITLETGASLTGRALARNAAVTLDTNAVTVP